MKTITENLAILQVAAAITAGSSIDQDSDIIDMGDRESVTFVVPIADSAATGVATIKVEEGAQSDLSDAADVTDATATVTCASNDDINGQLLIVEYRHPRKRYVRLNLASATANIGYGAAIAIVNERVVPVVDASGKVAAKTLVSN